MTSSEDRKIVYISAHPADRYLYMDAIISALSELEDYSVEYTKIPQDNRRDLPDGAEVLVVVATEKYFTWQNSGFQSEFIPAIDRGIRVLPLLMEPHVMNLLNMRCGKRQFIDATESLDFALDSLCAYISSIGKEFKYDNSLPSVFVSYRKRDRLEREKLISIIENYSGREEFNLWYDRVINPGDNFSVAIRRAIEDCDLFVLLVTPSLLEENNYVARIEYPMAKRLGKKIIAVEAISTDRAELAARFSGLPKCVNIKQVGALYSKFKRLTKG